MIVAVIFLANIALSLFQAGAIVAGLEYWTDWNQWVCGAIVGLLVFGFRIPFISLPLGIVGAHYGWEWSWLSSIVLFTAPFLLVLAIAAVSGAAGKLLRW
jgi:hypothetical protein